MIPRVGERCIVSAPEFTPHEEGVCIWRNKNEGVALIQFDNYIHGHNGNGKYYEPHCIYHVPHRIYHVPQGLMGHCWYCRFDSIQVIPYIAVKKIVSVVVEI